MDIDDRGGHKVRQIGVGGVKVVDLGYAFRARRPDGAKRTAAELGERRMQSGRVEEADHAEGAQSEAGRNKNVRVPRGLNGLVHCFPFSQMVFLELMLSLGEENGGRSHRLNSVYRNWGEEFYSCKRRFRPL